jgi:hypothetical protein
MSENKANYVRTIQADNPEDYCLRLSACLAVDKGISSTVIEVIGGIKGTWALIAEGIALTVQPRKAS